MKPCPIFYSFLEYNENKSLVITLSSSLGKNIIFYTSSTSKIVINDRYEKNDKLFSFTQNQNMVRCLTPS